MDYGASCPGIITFNYYSAEHDEIDVYVDGNKATMTWKSRVVAAVYGGGKNTSTY